ncbi:TetR/AcrR family transcriptional regulator [Microbulbifer sp. 2205BS26-8]|uniref:TetR/AcrR family transcriptional regulator n=1 Tax=Microbulbifer sp. 2205BS26-8 TaxID=3064386 RepID=UPI00273D9E5B|nr:TetR/AcrR family transcriptional regulator [Microbulbifer sp. 2205BS26-8]MDP5209545.1 TetR/AcrR family transcriptional regulator [Microbulbifer sp. 2205BS26-8]
MQTEKKQSSNSVGRPRSISRQKIIDAALCLGGDKITMKQVADELGVGIATLYKYVANKDELQQLVVGQLLANLSLPKRRGRHRREYIRDFYQSLCQAMIRQPKAIRQLMEGGFGVETSQKLKSDFTQEILNSGMSSEMAAQIYVAVCQASIGAAVTELELEAQRQRRRKISNNDSSNQIIAENTGNFLIDALLEKIDSSIELYV